MPEMLITNHAVDRFILRCGPGLDRASALSVLREAAMSARPLEERTFAGQKRWLAPAWIGTQAILITKHDPRDGLICVTVVTPEDEERTNAGRSERVAEVTAAYERAGAPAPEESPPPALFVVPAIVAKSARSLAKNAAFAEKIRAKQAAAQEKKRAREERVALESANREARILRRIAHAVTVATAADKREIARLTEELAMVRGAGPEAGKGKR